MDKRPAKIFPRNLTARAGYQVPGNPVVTRLEDAVANCYPGLELDVRNFDRRFFPGLVFEFVGRDDNTAAYDEPNRYGAWLRYVDYLLDPDLQSEEPHVKKLLICIMLNAGTLGAHDDWYLEWVEQGGKRLSMRENNPDNPKYPLDGLYVWRLLRGLVPGPLKIGLKRRNGDDIEVVFEGWRRHFTDAQTGVISGAYLPGELLQSLCSPWQHDFRDCACMYWASNHPDAVFQELEPGEPRLLDGEAADPLLNVRVDWLRAKRSRDVSAAAGNTIAKNRPYQFDHFQINQEWQSLNVVLHDREIASVYVPPREALANPYKDKAELVCELRKKLGPMEMALALEYLYARFSVLSPEEAEKLHGSAMKDVVTFIRSYLMIVATCEMQHLRWVNELLWILDPPGPQHAAPFEPVLQPAKKLPDGKGGSRDAELRPLTPETLTDFINIERPSGFLDGAYARVVATLRSPEYPPHAIELAERIDSDGADHYSRFRLIELRLKAYKADPPPYLRNIRVGTKKDAAGALKIYQQILHDLGAGYQDYAHNQLAQGAPLVNAARTNMNELLKAGEDLAKGGIGIPFWLPK